MRADIISRIFLFSLALLLSAGLVAGIDDLSFNAELRPINNTIMPGGTAIIEIDVTNMASSSQSFRLRTPDFRWDILSSPRSDYFSGFTVDGGDTHTLNLQYTPRGDLRNGRYNVRTQIDSRTTGESLFVDVPINIRRDHDEREYAATIVVSATVNNNDVIDPRESSTLVLELDNRNPLNISELDVEVESRFINETFTTSLPPLDLRRFEFNFDVDDYLEPGVNDFRVVARYEGETIGRTPLTFPVQVMEYSEIDRQVTEDSGFLRTKTIIELRNRGNVVNSDKLDVSTNFFARIFTSAEPSPEYTREEDGLYMNWDVEISPGSSVVIDVDVNYRPLVYILIVGAVGLVLYYMLRSPLVVKKTAAAFDIKEEGISEIKILIHVRNRTPRNFTTFNVSEYVPKIATFVKSESLGSILPDKVLNHEKKGTLLKWNFEAIEPFEERIIIYKMKLNFAVLGKLNLPTTVVKFKDEQGTNYTTRSNRLKIVNNKEEENGKGRKKKKNR